MGRSDLFSEFDLKVPPRLGLGFLVLYRGDPFLNNLYNDDYDNPEKLKDASYTTITGKISIGYYISRKLSAGASIGIHYQQLPTSTDDNGKWIYSSATGIGAFDIATSYKCNDRLTLALVVRDLFAMMNWQLNDGANSTTIEDRPIPSFTIASKYSNSLRHKPFIWTTDLKGYLVDGEWNSLSRPEGYLSSGVEWQYWKSFYLRFGLGDILLNGDITSNTKNYFSEFPCKISAGFSAELSKFRKGMFVNYGMATDKTWAGLDQQLDLTLGF